MSAAPHFLKNNDFSVVLANFNRLVSKLPKEFHISYIQPQADHSIAAIQPQAYSIAAIQLQADWSCADMFEHMGMLEKERKAASQHSLEIYNEAICNYQKLIEVGAKIMAYYKKKLAAKEITIKAYNHAIMVMTQYYNGLIQPNYQQLQDLLEELFSSFRQQALMHYELASKLRANAELLHEYAEDYEEIYTTAIQKHQILLLCLQYITNAIDLNEPDNQEKKRSVIALQQGFSKKLFGLEYYLKQYQDVQKAAEESASVSREKAPELTASDSESSASEGSSSEESISQSPVSEPTPKPLPNTTLSSGGNFVVFPAPNENKQWNKRNFHHSEEEQPKALQNL